MPENSGLYQKFLVRRRDGRDLPGGDRCDAAYLTLDVVHDPHAARIVRAMAAAYAQDPVLGRWVGGLLDLADELDARVKDGPMVRALREPLVAEGEAP